MGRPRGKAAAKTLTQRNPPAAERPVPEMFPVFSCHVGQAVTPQMSRPFWGRGPKKQTRSTAGAPKQTRMITYQASQMAQQNNMKSVPTLESTFGRSDGMLTEVFGTSLRGLE